MSIYVASTANGYRPKFGTSSNLIELDAFIVENHTFSNSIQSHPVEKGSMVTDGVTANPTELELECTLSPFAIDVTKRADVTRADLGYRKLKSMFGAKTPVTVFTGLTTYHNMVISSISIPRNKETSKTLRFNINFRKVRIVGTTSFAIEELLPQTDFVEIPENMPPLRIEDHWVAYPSLYTHKNGVKLENRIEFDGEHPIVRTYFPENLTVKEAGNGTVNKINEKRIGAIPW